MSRGSAGLDRLWKNTPAPVRIGVGVLVLVLGAFAYFNRDMFQQGQDDPMRQFEPDPKVTVDPDTGPRGSFLFCFWNVENLYDGDDNPREKRNDEENWFGTDRKAYEYKQHRLAEALLSMNGGAGPDILAVCEVETESALRHLMGRMNRTLEKKGYGDRKYVDLAFKQNNTGRRIMAGVISRFDIDNNRVDRLDVRGRPGRILRVPVRDGGRELLIFVSHWTSRRSDETGDRRAKYAQGVYGAFKAVVNSNPEAAVILCGDFNDEFHNESMRTHLHAVATPGECLNAPRAAPRPLCLSADVDTSKEGTIQYRGKNQVFDHICVSPGLLKRNMGWGCYPETFRIYNPPWILDQKGGPRRFGRRGDLKNRGFSDHLPVLVRLTVS